MEAHPLLPFLTPQLAGQIVQIWAVQTSAFATPRQIARALPEPETPDYDPRSTAHRPKRPDSHRTPCGSMWQILQPLANTPWTGFGAETMTYMSWLRLTWTNKSTVHSANILRCEMVRGRHAFGMPAHTNATNEGNHGGILILHDTFHGTTQLEPYHLEGCGYQAFLWEAKARSIPVAAVYFKTNETIQGTTNSQLLARILA